MGNLLAKDTPVEAPPEPQEPALSPEQVFEIKNQFLECWTLQDVVEWLRFSSLSEFVGLAEQLMVDGDALILFSSSLRSPSLTPTDNNNNSNDNDASQPLDTNANTEEANESEIADVKALSPGILQVIEQFSNVNKETWPTLVEKINLLVDRYNNFIGAKGKKDEEFPPYTYPTFESEHPKNRNALVMFYHDNTQHGRNKGSRSVERAWYAQPRIYRRYFGTPYVALPLPAASPATSTPYNNLFFSNSAQQPLTSKSISEFFLYALGVTARRDLWTLTSSPRSAWVKRSNPSSGGLHPIECYTILPGDIPELPASPSLYHYAVRHHGLEQRAEFTSELWAKLGISKDCFLIGISSIHWREVWKYGERGFRYCMLDAGHAYGSLAISAKRLGWKITLLPFVETNYVEEILGLADSNKFVPNEERERGLILGIVDTKGNTQSLNLPDLRDMLQNQTWKGTPNWLSAVHRPWDIVSCVDRVTTVEKIDVEQAANMSQPQNRDYTSLSFGAETEGKKGRENLAQLSKEASLESVINQRRSALEYIDRPISLDQFVHILYCILESNSTLNCPWEEQASLFIFAYNVDGLPSGIYALVRNESELENLKKSTEQSAFLWETPKCVTSMPLYLLKEIPRAELSSSSYVASCNQHIASKGAFSLGMFVNIERFMEQMGPSGYCRAHLECGALGQVLYLEAHALGLGATGMGCYLDDLSRETFGLERSPYWPLYHFAIGVPSKDNRYASYTYGENMFEGVLDECVSVMKPRKK